MALLDDSPRSADVVADGEVLALTIGRSGFAKLLRAEPALAQALLRTLAARLRAAEQSRLSELSGDSVLLALLRPWCRKNGLVEESGL